MTYTKLEYLLDTIKDDFLKNFSDDFIEYKKDIDVINKKIYDYCKENGFDLLSNYLIYELKISILENNLVKEEYLDKLISSIISLYFNKTGN